MAGNKIEPLFYNMDHKNRGHALIFNHEKFDSETLEQRYGTNKDKKRLKNSLLSLGFSVTVYEDKKMQEVDDILTEESKGDHTDADCLFVAVLTHGEANGDLHARDQPYNSNNLWKKFTDDNCKSLAGKPKLFFIQACRGEGLDKGIRLVMKTDSSSNNENHIFNHRDFLIAYSTIPGFFSWRNSEDGSWFVQSLCDQLDENGTKHDILYILTMVNRRVAIKYESHVTGDRNLHAKKQIPCIRSMLVYLLQFNVKTN